MMPPTNPPRTRQHTRSRPRPKRVAFAVGAVVLLAGAAFVATHHESRPASRPAHAEPLDALPVFAAPLALEAVPPSGALDAAALAQLQGALDNATARLAVAVAATGALGEDAPGAHQVLAGAVPRTWTVPLPAASLPSASGGTFHYVPGSGIAAEAIEIGPPQTGEDEVDSALSEATAVLAEAKALWQSPEVQAVFAALDGTPVGTPGIARDPFGAHGAVQPDEEVALMAKGHADEVLGTVGPGYDQLGAGLDRMIEVQEGLVADVEAALEAVDSYEAQSTAAAEAELSARLLALRTAAEAYGESVRQVAAAYSQAVMDARDEALAALDAAKADAEARIDAAAAEARADIEEAAANVQSVADARISQIEQHEAHAAAVFQRRADQGADVSSDVQYHAATVLKAKADLRAQAMQAQAEVQERVAALEAEVETAKAAVEQETGIGRAAVEQGALEALAWADGRAAQLLQDVDGELEAALAKQASLHGTVEGAVAAFAGAHRGQVLAHADDIVQEARAHATSTLGAVEIVQAGTLTGVGVDLDTISKVAQDYGSVPAGERKERAQEWDRIHGQLAGTLAGVLLEGEAVADQAARLLVAAEASAEGLARI